MEMPRSSNNSLSRMDQQGFLKLPQYKNRSNAGLVQEGVKTLEGDAKDAGDDSSDGGECNRASLEEIDDLDSVGDDENLEDDGGDPSNPYTQDHGYYYYYDVELQESVENGGSLVQKGKEYMELDGKLVDKGGNINCNEPGKHRILAKSFYRFSNNAAEIEYLKDKLCLDFGLVGGLRACEYEHVDIRKIICMEGSRNACTTSSSCTQVKDPVSSSKEMEKNMN